MVGVDVQGVAQHLDHRLTADEWAGHFDVQSQLEAAVVGHVEHLCEVALGLVVGAAPWAYQLTTRASMPAPCAWAMWRSMVPGSRLT